MFRNFLSDLSVVFLCLRDAVYSLTFVLNVGKVYGI